MSKQLSRLSWKKRIVFNFLMLIGVFLITESFSLALCWIYGGSTGEHGVRRHMIATQNPFRASGLRASPILLHPYIGAVQQPVRDEANDQGVFHVREFGFIDDDLPIHARTPDQVIVAILGGSVAHQFSLQATETLANELSKSPEYAGREFKFVRLATNGYKQPQQLMTIAYLMSLGAEFDVVINLDGFNEIALPGIDNIPFGVFYAYPRDWGSLIAFFKDPEFLKRAGYVSYLRETQRELARWAERRPWVYSPTAQLVWTRWNARKELQIVAATQAMAALAQKEMSYCSGGPPRQYQSKEEMYRDCVQLWQRSSILLHRLCETSGARYFHFLQPNQHLAGSKPIEKEEVRMIATEGNPNSAPVKEGYPLLQAAAPALAAQGVAFFDLTDVFANHSEQIYIDGCCHINHEGNQIMARAICQRIRDQLARVR